MTFYRETNTRDRNTTLGLVVLTMVLAAVAGFILLPSFVWLFLLITAILLTLLVRWHTRTFGYRCPECSCLFEISAVRNFFSPHMPSDEGGVKYLRCPSCGALGWATMLAKTNE